ncbi:MAG TPA: ATP-binding cassette domain-containing protein, partial [Reyranella sp.]|nr:ATP-binding cassette domain-containing protein [Reyranella sp.]
MSPALEIRDYALDYVTRGGRQRVLQAINLAISAGEVLGLVGESGSGKTSLAWAIMRSLPANAREAPAGRIRLGDTDLRAASAKALETIRGRRMSMVFQDPSTALNPTLTIGRQVTEVLVRHRGLSEREAWQEAIQALEHVDLR